MSCAGSVVKPPARLAVPNTASPASSMPLRPNLSDRLPKVSSSAAKTRLKESTTHCSWVVVACSSRTMAGNATFTSVVSRLTRKAASSSATRIIGLDRIVLPLEWVVPGAVAGRWLRGSAGPYCRAARPEFRACWRAISCITYGCIDVGPSPGDPPGGGTVSTPSRQAGGNVTAWLFFGRRDHQHGQAPRPGPHRGPAGRSEGPSCQGRSRRTIGRWIRIRSTVLISSASHPSLGPSKHTGVIARSHRAACQASPDPRARVRPIATSAHPARCLTERRPRGRQGTWGPCRRADLRSSSSRWRTSSSIMYGCIVFTY